MQRALESLRKSSKSVVVNDYEVDTTHYYIKFSPESEKHLDLLSQDQAFILYDYPLDREVKIQGNYYVDPDAPSDKPMPLYASVKVDHTLPSGVPHVVRSHLHIPDDNSDFEYVVARSPVLESFIESLVYESLDLTGNKEQVTSSPGARSRSWRPSGRIQTYDDTLERVIGIEGIEVRARRWFTTHTGTTSSSGSFSVNGTFKNPANYSFKFERYHFKIRTGGLLFNGAGVDGPKLERAWYYTTGRDSAEQYYATIFQLASHYYYDSIKGLNRPPLNGSGKTQLKIKAYLSSRSDRAGSFTAGNHFLGLASPIHMYTYSSSSEGTYSTVIHELAHAAHWDSGRTDYRNTDRKVKESWAMGVAQELTLLTYSSYDLNEGIYHSEDSNYTGVVEDMIDGISGYDKVTGYTISQIESALIGKRTWTTWRDNIKSKYNNTTEKHLDAVFAYWD